VSSSLTPKFVDELDVDDEDGGNTMLLLWRRAVIDIIRKNGINNILSIAVITDNGSVYES